MCGGLLPLVTFLSTVLVEVALDILLRPRVDGMGKERRR